MTCRRSSFSSFFSSLLFSFTLGSSGSQETSISFFASIFPLRGICLFFFSFFFFEFKFVKRITMRFVSWQSLEIDASLLEQ